jgi:drug/metabolite transporter (DMT)-like permease
MKKALFQLHIAVFLAGFTGLLGALIQLNEGLLVWYRMLLTVLVLGVVLWYKNELKTVSGKDMIKISGVGAIVALHWVSFYGSIKYANVSIALVCFSSIGLFTALLEPVFFKRRIDPVELILGLMAISGIYLIFNFNPEYSTGIALGIISALLAVLFSILNKQFVDRVPPKPLVFFELGGGWLFLSLMLPVYLYLLPTSKYLPDAMDWFWLAILAVVCTVWAFELQLKALKKISPFTNNLIYNLEPIYGIALAFIFLQENKEFTIEFYWGLGIIILAVALQMLRMLKIKD